MVQAREKATAAIVLHEYFTEQEKATIAKVEALSTELKAFFLEREDIIDAMFVARLSKQHLVMIGPPGTAKSYLIECFTRLVDGSTRFEWQVTKFTTPEEIFGPYSIRDLKDGRYKRITDGKLPCADIVYLDEVFNANSSILNALNSSINERVFEGEQVPLECLYGATNFIPEEKVLVAFFDRLLFRFIVDDIHETGNFERMLALSRFKASESITRDEFATLQSKIDGVSTRQIIPIVSKIRELLRIEHVEPSSRRFKWALRALQARAVLSGREFCTVEDVFLLRHVLWTEPKEIPLVEGVITKAIDPDMGRIKDFFDQAQDIEKQLAPLDPKDQNAMATIGEGTQKLKQVADSIASMRTSVTMMPKVAAIAEKLEKAVREIHKNILKTKLGVAF